MQFAKIVFWGAGIWGVLVLTPLYFLFDRIGVEQPPAITHPEFFYGFVGVGLAWQVAFLVVGTDPARYRPMMIPCVLEKFSYAVAVDVLYAQGRVGLSVPALGAVDTLLGVLFLVAFFKTKIASSSRGGDSGRPSQSRLKSLR